MTKKTDQLENLILIGGEIRDLSKSRRIQTEEGRAIMNVMVRLAETLAFGAPQTKAIADSAHHE